MDDAIEHLNKLADGLAQNQVPMRTTSELLAFFKNPPQRAYSAPLEQAMTAVVELFGVADENGRRAIASRLNGAARKRFLGYAATMAVLAVRAQSPALIGRGLLALIIEAGFGDYRDSIVALAKLHHSAVKLGMNARNAFQKAAALADPGMIKSEMHGFPLRPPKDRELKAFGETEEIGEDGFRYKQVLPK